MSPSNFNYTVEFNKGSESLKQGRLRQAEQSFKYLVDKFPGAEGGYSGLAKVYFEQEDLAAALRVLRDGAVAVTRAGDRSAAITLLRKAVGLEPRDFATHRRLAAALALVGDTDAAVQEYARFIRDLRDRGERERAKNEVAYANGQLRGVAGVSSLEAIAGGTPALADELAAPAPPAAETTRFSEHEGSGTALRPQTADPWVSPRAAEPKAFTPPPPSQSSTPADDPWASPPSTTYPETRDTDQHVREITLENDPWSMSPPTAAESWRPPQESSSEDARAQDTEPREIEAQEQEAVPEPEPAETTESWSQEATPGSANGEPAVDAEPETVEAAAAQYLATRDPRAAGMALEAARHYIREGHTDAASDLLLQLIAAGVADHDAQRLLVDVARTLGKREVARMKCQLLVQALLLDGRNDLAAEVEALALAD